MKPIHVRMMEVARMQEIQLQTLFEQSIQWASTHILLPTTLSQIALSLGLFFVAILFAKKPQQQLDYYIRSRWDDQTLEQHNEEALVGLVLPLAAMALQWLAVLVAIELEAPHNILEIIAKLLVAWVAIRLASCLLRYPLWSKLFAFVAWTIAALSITGLLDATTELLDSLAISIGEARVSALNVMQGLLSLVILLWLAGFLSRFLERHINKLPNLTPSVRVLLSKFSKLTLIALAILIGLDSIGIDLTALTIFGGAIGLGLGFGLQKVVSNLVSGVILLLDRSVKPGDVIEIGGSFGWVNTLGSRYVSVLTRDGVEHLIPNEHLITENVVNWSHSNTKIRLKIPLGVSYKSDLHKAMELCVEACNEQKRVLPTPEPVCRLIKFGDSALELEVRVWINDPVQGVMNVQSSILIAIYDKFKEHNITIPYPQIDVHLAPDLELKKKPAKVKAKK